MFVQCYSTQLARWAGLVFLERLPLPVVKLARVNAVGAADPLNVGTRPHAFEHHSELRFLRSGLPWCHRRTPPGTDFASVLVGSISPRPPSANRAGTQRLGRRIYGGARHAHHLKTGGLEWIDLTSSHFVAPLRNPRSSPRRIGYNHVGRDSACLVRVSRLYSSRPRSQGASESRPLRIAGLL